MCYTICIVMMKFGIDTFGGDHARSGIGSYLHSFAANIPDLDDIEFELFGSELDKYTYTSEKDISYKAVYIPDSSLAEKAWHYTSVNKFARQAGYDCVLYPAAERVLPLSFKVPGVAAINSIMSTHLRERKDALLVKQALSSVNHIIAASQYIRMDLIKNGVNPSKISVIHNGIDSKLFHPNLRTDEETVNIKPFAIKRPYFIYGSRLSGPEKKHIELIKAFSLFKEKTNLPHRLVLAGNDEAYSEAVHKAAFDSKATQDIFLTGYFPHESFPKLYAGAEACLFPSVNEGVGLPVLEAMAIGIPVACSKGGALPEMGGEAAYYFDADNIEEIALAMEKIVTDTALREKMISAGLERAKQFSWENTVKRTTEIMMRLVD